MHETCLIWLETGKIGNWKSQDENQIIRPASDLCRQTCRDTRYEPDGALCTRSSSAPALQKRDESIGAPASCPSPRLLWEPAAHAFRLWDGNLIKTVAKTPEWYDIVIPSWNRRTAAQFCVPTLYRAMAAIWSGCKKRNCYWCVISLDTLCIVWDGDSEPNIRRWHHSVYGESTMPNPNRGPDSLAFFVCASHTPDTMFTDNCPVQWDNKIRWLQCQKSSTAELGSRNLQSQRSQFSLFSATFTGLIQQ